MNSIVNSPEPLSVSFLLKRDEKKLQLPLLKGEKWAIKSFRIRYPQVLAIQHPTHTLNGNVFYIRIVGRDSYFFNLADLDGMPGNWMEYLHLPIYISELVTVEIGFLYEFYSNMKIVFKGEKIVSL